MIMTKRDWKILNLVEQFKVLDSSHIEKLVFGDKQSSYAIAARRLQLLTKHKALKRSRTYINQRYIYFIDKPKQLRHRLILAEFYARLSEACEVVDFKPEYEIGSLRADALCVTKTPKGTHKLFFVEVHISHNKFDYEKYEVNKHIIQEELKASPTLLIITDQRVKPKDKTIIIDTSLKNIKEVEDYVRL